MDIRELRIGNLFDTVNHGNGITSPNKQPMWIQAIELHSVELCHLKDSIHNTRRFLKKPLNDIIPIPITEEWLVKFAFIDFEKQSFSYYVENNGEIVFKKSGLDILYDYPIQYVHQLQNLFFSLSGEELELK